MGLRMYLENTDSCTESPANFVAFQIVPESSAAPILDNTDRAGLRSDHRSICKFASRNAPGYKLVIASLRRYARQAPDAIWRRWQAEKAILSSMRQNEAADLLGNR